MEISPKICDYEWRRRATEMGALPLPLRLRKAGKKICQQIFTIAKVLHDMLITADLIAKVDTRISPTLQSVK
jgi:hypothetical protein